MCARELRVHGCGCCVCYMEIVAAAERITSQVIFTVMAMAVAMADDCTARINDDYVTVTKTMVSFHAKSVHQLTSRVTMNASDV